MNPDCILIVYGSLAPGKVNHSVIEHIEGTWRSGTIHGRLENEGWGAGVGYPAFVKSDDPVPIAADILFSVQLPNHWDQIDAFEGDEYVREIIDFETADGVKGQGYIYALRK